MYEQLINDISPVNYSTKMKEQYPDRFFEMHQSIDPQIKEMIEKFNSGNLDIKDIISNWDLFENKNLGYYIKKYSRILRVEKNKLERIITTYNDLIKSLQSNDRFNFFEEILKLSNEDEERNFLFNLLNSSEGYFKHFTNNDYKKIFKIVSFNEYLNSLIKNNYFLIQLSEEDFFNNDIPFELIREYKFRHLINNIGFENIINNEYREFFSKNNFEVLRSLAEFIYLPHNKVNINEEIKKMIEYGIKNDSKNKDLLANYQYIKGKFRERYPELFISEDAPDELKKAFYTQTITPQLIADNLEYIPWLENKDLACCFEKKYIECYSGKATIKRNLYELLLKKELSNKELLYFIVEYKDVLEDYFQDSHTKFINLDIKGFNIKALKHYIIRHLQEKQKRESNIVENIPNEIATFVLDTDAPDELKQAFYNKNITPQLLAEHPNYIRWLQNKDLRGRFKSIDIIVDDDSKKITWQKKKVDLYDFLYEKTTPNILLDFFVEYKEILDYLILSLYYNVDFIELSPTFDFEKVQAILLENVRANLIFRAQLQNGEIIPYPKVVPKKMLKLYPTMFLEKSAPEELKQAVYSRSINSKFIKKHPEYHEDLKKLDLRIIFNSDYIKIDNERGHSRVENFIKKVEELIGKEETFNIILTYGEYIEKLSEIDEFKKLKINYNFSKDDIINAIESIIPQAIIDGKIKYNEDLPEHFKINNQKLFLANNVPEDIRVKFYNKNITLAEFNLNPNLIDLLGDTNICLGFTEEFSWIYPLFSEETNNKVANSKRLKIILAYSKIQDESLKVVFKNFMIENINDIDMKKLQLVEEVLSRISRTNSVDLLNISSSLASNLLKTDNPLYNLSKIEKIFVKNNIPLFGKIFLSFQILYPNLVKIKNDKNKFDFTDDSRMSPELKEQSLGNVRFGKTSNEKRFNIIFNDLLRIAYRSNNRSFMNYLENIELGNELYLKIIQEQIDVNNLSSKDKEILDIFVKHLQTLFENTVKGSKDIIDFEKYTLFQRIEILSKLFGVNKNYDLKDRIVRSFCYSAGIKSFEELKQLALSATREADARGRRYARKLESGNKFVFENGDFIRGFGDYKVLAKSLNSGNVSKEFLSVFTGKSDSDTTPLDVDISLITDVDDDTTIYDLLDTGSAKSTGFGFGNIYAIFKKDNPNFYITRDKDGNLTHQQYNPLKNELFGTKLANLDKYDGHWGIRTGFAFTDVDYILYKKKLVIDKEQPYDQYGNVNYINSNVEIYDDLPIIKFEIAKNGYYIPVIDFSGRLIFTEKEYEDLRKKMAGLSYYGVPEYKLSSNLEFNGEMELKDEIISSQEIVHRNNRQISDLIVDILASEELTVYMGFNSDLTKNGAEVYSTGSTSRDTNVPYDSDFDFLIKIDRDIYDDKQKLSKLKSKFKEKLGLTDGYSGKIVGTIRDDDGNQLDIEISFVPRTDKLEYSTDSCLSERLENIAHQYPEQYHDVIANIVYAKKILKANGVYKTAKSDAKQGGIGGVGIENWILQHGGSFYDASISFLEAAEGRTFEEFIKIYQIWDFGSNHYSEKDNVYPHENFIYEVREKEGNTLKMLKMTEDGYNKMVQVLREYVNNYNKTQTASIKK